jgi:hypothetical protein
MSGVLVFGAGTILLLAATSPARAGIIIPKLSVVGGTGVPGSTVAATIALSDDLGDVAASADVDVTFPPGQVTFMGPVSENCTIDPRLAATHEVGGHLSGNSLILSIFVSDTPQEIPHLGNGPLASCDFRINPGVPAGTAALTLENPGLFDENGNPLNVQTVDGAIIIVEPQPTPTVTPSRPATPTNSPIRSITATATRTGSAIVTATATRTGSGIATPTITGTRGASGTATPTITGGSVTRTATATITGGMVPTSTATATATTSTTGGATPTPTVTGGATSTVTGGATATVTGSIPATATRTVGTVTASPTNTGGTPTVTRGTPTRTVRGRGSGDSDSCNIVPAEGSHFGGTLALLIAPALLVWARRRRS